MPKRFRKLYIQYQCHIVFSPTSSLGNRLQRAVETQKPWVEKRCTRFVFTDTESTERLNGAARGPLNGALRILVFPGGVIYKGSEKSLSFLTRICIIAHPFLYLQGPIDLQGSRVGRGRRRKRWRVKIVLMGLGTGWISFLYRVGLWVHTWVRVGKSCRRMSIVLLLRSVIFPLSSDSDKMSNSYYAGGDKIC